MARNTYYVSPADFGDWKVTKEGGTQLSTHAKKEDAIDEARSVAKANRPSQVKVQKDDGTYQTEWTYDDDPYPPKG